MFRYKKSVPLSYEEQGYIYFASLLYAKQPAQMQQRIVNLCMDAGGEYYQALFEFVTSGVGATAVCTRHYLSRSTLERVVRKYYIAFAQSL